MIMARNADGSYSEITAIKTKDGSNISKIIGRDGSVYFASTINATAEGYPCILPKSVGKNAVNYSIYGNSTQDGTPSPDNPVEVVSAGELVTDGEFAEKYKIPVVTSGEDSKPVTTNIYLNEPLRKIGDYADVLNSKEQSVTRKIKKIVFDGTEDWSAQIKSYKSTYFYLKIDGVIDYIECTHYLQNNISVNNENIGCNIQHKTDINQDVVIIRPPNVETYDIDSWESYLAEQYAAGTPVTVWYVLVEETEELAALPKIPTFKGTTIITTGTEVQPQNIEITYKSRR